MNQGNKTKTASLFLGDVVALYASLLLTLFIRYGTAYYAQFVSVHFAPFTIIFVLWLIVFYIAGLYDLRRLQNSIDFLKTLSFAILTNVIITVTLFYLVPIFGIAPKTNLFIFIVIFSILETLWRRSWNRVAGSAESPNRVLLVGTGSLADEVVKAVESNPQLGFAILARASEDSAEREPESVEKIAAELGANRVVVPRHLKRHSQFGAMLYRLFGTGIAVSDIASFYEEVMRKIPLADLEETWFIENIESAPAFFDPLKRAVEAVGATIIGIILLPFELLFAFIVKISSPGPAIYQQVRVGRYGKPFTLYKFRTMRTDAEKEGAQWAAHANDPRSTAFGKLLRASHLDELPQLWNIIRGDISFVGPRPERPEFVSKLKHEVPYYEARLLVKPGVTGWAQINYRNDQTIDDVKQKLQYDIYYLKNRSIVLDVAVILKTIKSVFINPE